MPKGQKHTPEQIDAILRQLESGETAEAVCRSLNISEATLYRWKQQYGALELRELKELKALRVGERPFTAGGCRPGAEHPGAEGSERKSVSSWRKHLSSCS
jgi:hypothetical protein